tara:strand:- start:1293 stop:1586 length:294 start_codon:yes stop_codon:yes gene_type:complete
MTNDIDIKRSAAENIPFKTRRSASRLSGEKKTAVLKCIANKIKDLDPSYDSVVVIDYPDFDKQFDHMLVNYYYSQETNPTTYIRSIRVYTSGEITNA